MAYISLPGTSGNSASTADVNLLDADSSHIHQSIGGWSRRGSNPDPTREATPSSPFGDYALKQTFTQGNVDWGAMLYDPVDFSGMAGQPLYMSFWARGTATDPRARAWMDGTSQNVAVSFALTADWQWFSLELFSTTAATPTGGRVGFSSGASGGYVEAVGIMVTNAEVASFVPSLRIVGDLEVEAKVAANDWTIGGGATGYQYLFGTIGSSLAAGEGGWHLSISDVGAVTIMHSDAALADLRTEQSALYTLVDGEATTIKVTFDNSGLVTYYQDGVEVDDDVVTNTGAAGGGTSPLCVGTFDGSGTRMFAGDVYYCLVRDGIDGPIVAKFDAEEMVNHASLQVTNTDTWVGDTDSRTWTLNGSDSTAYYPELLGGGTDAVMSHLSNLDSPPASLGIVGALTEKAGLSVDSDYRFALLSYLNIDT